MELVWCWAAPRSHDNLDDGIFAAVLLPCGKNTLVGGETYGLLRRLRKHVVIKAAGELCSVMRVGEAFGKSKILDATNRCENVVSLFEG